MKVADLKFEIIIDYNKILRNKVEPLKQAKVNFDNGYQASIITGYGAYANSNNPYELALINQKTGDFCGEEIFGDMVIGYLNEEKLQQYLNKIEALPACKGLEYEKEKSGTES